MGVDAEMFVRVRPPLDEAAVRRLAFEAGEAFGYDRFLSHREGDPHHLEAVSVYEQDGPDIVPEMGEQFLRVHLFTHFYGPDYERGDLPFIVELAKWLEDKTGGEVWYGGDSSGECAYRFDVKARDALWQHFLTNGHRPYETFFDRERDGEDCPLCAVRLVRYGWGPSYAAWHCAGCGFGVVSKNGEVKRGWRLGDDF